MASPIAIDGSTLLLFSPSGPCEAMAHAAWCPACSWYDNSTGNLTYRSQLDTINSLFGLMTDGVLGGPGFYGFRASYDFDTARNLTGDAVSRRRSQKRSNLL